MKRHVRAWAAACAALCMVPGIAMAQTTKVPVLDDAAWQRVRSTAARIGEELARACPPADPASEPAFNACRKAMYGESALRAALKPVVLWGRQSDPKKRLVDTNLTQFAPDVLTGMYMPLFMFDGRHDVSYDSGERQFLIRFRAAFRNRLAPGQFPYPFWHNEDKWTQYQGTRDLLMWWDPAKNHISAALFTMHSKSSPLVRIEPIPKPTFDGQWTWTDARGHSQPKVTLFDGLFSADNPYIKKVDAQYQKLALRMREAQCDQCHVPDNPAQSKRLVLLQTPAHAAGEIQRLLKSVRRDSMPLDDAGVEAPLQDHLKKALLEDGEAFAAVVESAKRWEVNANRPLQAQLQTPEQTR